MVLMAESCLTPRVGVIPALSVLRTVNAPLLRLAERDEPIVAPDNNKDGSWAG